MSAPRIAFLWHGDRNIGGGEHSTALLVRNLAPDFHPVVFYSRRNRLIDAYERDGIETVATGWNPALTGVYRDQITPLGTVARAWHFGAAVTRTARQLRRHRIDMLHAVDNLSKLVGGLAGRLAGVPVVAHCRDELTHSTVERLLLHYQRLTMDRVIAVADTIGDLFVRDGRRPAHVVTIHNGVDLRQFEPAVTDRADDIPWETFGGDVVIGVVALFDPVKGHRHLFRALTQLTARGVTRWRCLVVGEGREDTALRSLVSELGLADRVLFVGYRSDVARILAGLEAVVIPSDQEAFPRIALEAMAMATPVVASRVGGLAEAVIDGETGLLVRAGDVDGLADALARIVTEPDLRVRMGCAGRARVERLFTIDRNVRRTKEVYADVLGCALVEDAAAV